MKAPRYQVYSVLGDGNSWIALKTDSALEALAKVRSEEEKYKSHRNHAHGIWDTENPERGDVEDDLEEANNE